MPAVSHYHPKFDAYSSESCALAELDSMFRACFFNQPAEPVSSSAVRIAKVVSSPLSDLGSIGFESKKPTGRSSLSDRGPVVLLPNPRPLQMACWEPSSSELDKPFVLESDAPFAPGARLAQGALARRAYGLKAPRLKPFIPPASPEKLVLSLSKSLAPKKVRSLNIEEDLALLQISSKRACSVSGSVVTFRI